MTQVNLSGAEQLPAIDHPSQSSWFEDGGRILTMSQKFGLYKRYMGSDLDLDPLFSLIEISSTMSDSYRHLHERTTLGELGLSSWVGPQSHGNNEADANGLDRRTLELDQYHSYVGKPDKVLQLTKWFGRLSTEYYEQPMHTGLLKKLGIELGGKRQGGDWESTEDFDNMLRSLPGLISEEGSGQITILDSAEDRRVAYRYQQKPGIEYGEIRRRRAVANIVLDGMLPMRLFKESLGLIDLRYLSDNERAAITEDIALDERRLKDVNAAADAAKLELKPALVEAAKHEDKSKFKELLEKEKAIENSYDVLRRQAVRNTIAIGSHEGENNTPAAMIAGQRFYAASRSPEGTSRDINPISAHGVVVVDNPYLESEAA